MSFVFVEIGFTPPLYGRDKKIATGVTRNGLTQPSSAGHVPKPAAAERDPDHDEWMLKRNLDNGPLLSV
jgi:hypothetical protein